MKKVTRKDFLRKLLKIAGPGAVTGAAVAAGHALLKQTVPAYPVRTDGGETAAGSPRLIRPPGALDEKDFLAACIRCCRCQDACDIGAIQFFTETGGESFHTPFVDPALKACNLCMKCTKACPTGALRRLEMKDKEKVAMASVELLADLCLSHKARAIRDEQALLMEMGRRPTESTAAVERRGPCGECYMFCPLRGRAIELEPGAFLAPVVFKEHCVGCGMCEEICRVIRRGDPAIRVVQTRKRA